MCHYQCWPWARFQRSSFITEATCDWTILGSEARHVAKVIDIELSGLKKRKRVGRLGACKYVAVPPDLLVDSILKKLELTRQGNLAGKVGEGG